MGVLQLLIHLQAMRIHDWRVLLLPTVGGYLLLLLRAHSHVLQVHYLTITHHGITLFDFLESLLCCSLLHVTETLDQRTLEVAHVQLLGVLLLLDRIGVILYLFGFPAFLTQILQHVF
jgi:hypothetical protein